MNKKRCPWGESDPLYKTYHDREWGVPLHNDRKLFEMLILEGAQAGLSWITILRKRRNYQKAFSNFKAERIARYDKRKIRQLLANKGIVRNRLKVEAAIRNAQLLLHVQNEFGSFDRYIWQFVGGTPKRNRRTSTKQIPPTTRESDAMSEDLKKRGFRFVGSTICYAFMQACGMVNDHLATCFRYTQVRKKKGDMRWTEVKEQFSRSFRQSRESGRVSPWIFMSSVLERCQTSKERIRRNST